MGLGTAFRAFFSAIFNRQAAQKIDLVLKELRQPALPAPKNQGDKSTLQTDGKAGDAKGTAPAKPVNVPVQSTRSEAITLLSTLQREARLLDLVQEPLDAYSDAQVGAAARDVLRDTSKSLQRMFELRPLVESEEGTNIAIPADSSAARYRIVSTSSSKANPSSGVLVHPGWVATVSKVPQWNGATNDALVIAPAEVEVK